MSPIRRSWPIAGVVAAAVATSLASLAVERAPARTEEWADGAALLREADRIEGLLVLLVDRGGASLAEGYFDGTSADDLLHMRSGTKSVVSLLTGIALDRGLLRSIDQTVGEILGEAVEPFGADKGALTVRHLLTMSAGLAWREGESVEEFNDLVRSPDPLGHYLRRPFVSPPGERWAYCSAASHLLSRVLGEVTGVSASAFAREALFEPLGIDTYRWSTLRDGHSNGGAGLQLRPRDALKLGRLMLAGGSWNGRRVVSSHWLEEATRAHLAADGDTSYGFHWWIGPGEPVPAYAALGYAGQALIVVPDYEAVVVVNCRWRRLSRRPAQQMRDVMFFFQNRILPALS